MEPMTLGSPSNSPSPATNTFLPSFLIGESNIPITPRNNTLSPTKGRALAFAQSPTPTSPQQQSQSTSAFGMFQSPNSTAPNLPSVASHTQTNAHQSVSGPPTQGLFDALKAERNFIDNPSTPIGQNQSFRISGNHTFHNQTLQFNQSSFNDSYLNNSEFNNTSRLGITLSKDPNYRQINSLNDFASPRYQHEQFWITVYGFPSTATSTILSHFSQCGTIIDKIFPPQNGNWVHLKFSSRLECDKALNYHERIIGSNLMIGVSHCKDPSILDKENGDRNSVPVNRVRPLVHSAYQEAQSPTEVVLSSTVPKRSTGLMNKAMDMIFGW